MRDNPKFALVISLIAVLVFAPLGNFAYGETKRIEPSSFDVFIDLIVYRPIGALLIPIGTIGFVATLPFTAVSGKTTQTYNKLVKSPFNATFRRSLGDIHSI